jgi:hypothetical protein
MTYYRLAIQNRQTARWSWKTTPITSLKAVFELLRCYRVLLPQDRIRVFTASSKEELLAQSILQQNDPAQATQPAASTATWAKDIWEQHIAMRTAQVIQQGAPNATTGTAEGLSVSVLDQKRLEVELGPGGDHDVPYSFALPVSMPQVLAWMRLLGKVQRGELVP